MPLFTTETASEAAKRSHMPDSARFVRPIQPCNEPQENDTFRLTQLAITRAQIKNVNKLIGDEQDAVKLDRLASALSRLLEAERQLSGRPLPGSLRPTQSRSKDKQPSAE